ncbi:hypothetical protein ACMGD3_21950 [Lysinibacillus sphaericus]|uniref:hypothetical protein n=1 Tax=Lysinibacillus sphaericus TaxID=1421 RepID=UPI003F79CC35
MVKAKIIYYMRGEVIREWRGNYSCSSLYKSYGARRIFENDAKDLLNNELFVDFDCIELYKRNRSGVPRKLIKKVESFPF